MKKEKKEASKTFTKEDVENVVLATLADTVKKINTQNKKSIPMSAKQKMFLYCATQNFLSDFFSNSGSSERTVSNPANVKARTIQGETDIPYVEYRSKESTFYYIIPNDPKDETVVISSKGDQEKLTLSDYYNGLLMRNLPTASTTNIFEVGGELIEEEGDRFILDNLSDELAVKFRTFLLKSKND